jgi:hypothetical protein
LTIGRAAFGALVLGACGAFGCLPGDTRSPAGKLTVTVSPSDATAHGLTTADGWTIAFDRVLVSMGHTALGSDCTSYSEARYYRVLDLSAGSGQLLGLLFGLGDCDVQFRMSPPDENSVLGAGVSAADETFMRTAATDGYIINGGVALDVAGSASRDGTIDRFHWTFRPAIRFTDCAVTQDGQVVAGVSLHGGDEFTYDIRIETEGLFRDSADPALGAFRFDPFAAADAAFGNGDGDITLDELGLVPVILTLPVASGDPASGLQSWSSPDASMVIHAAGNAGSEGGATTAGSLADYVYLLIVPTLARFRDTGQCIPRPRAN